MALGQPTRDQVFLQSFGMPTAITSGAEGVYQHVEVASRKTDVDVDASLASRGVPLFYLPFTLGFWKTRIAVPTNQSQRAAIAQRQVMMYQPRNNPSRSQFNEGYTGPVQQFRTNNTWQTPSGQITSGERQTQPSTKFVSPFSSAPIPTQMPWDL